MTAVVYGARLAIARLLRTSTFVAALTACAFVAFAAALGGRESSSLAADRTLAGAVFGIALPIVGFLAFERLTTTRNLIDAMGSAPRHGLNRRSVVFGLLLSSAILIGGFGALLALIGVTCARGVADPSLSTDLLASGGIGLLGGATYACGFAFASTVGQRGNGRALLLVLDWIFGSGASGLALLWPRAYLRELIGGQPVLDLPLSAAAFASVALAALYAILALWRTPA